MYAIDFGTTNSLLGAATAGQIHPPIPLDPHARDQSILRSVLFFPNRKTCFYGAEAVQEFVKHDMEGRLIRSVKKFLPMRSFIGTYVEDRPMNLEDIIGVFLGELRRRANEHFKQDVDSVILGRPARFSQDDADDQFAQYRLERAAKIAGFKNVSFCPEPVAAAYEFKTTLKEEKLVLVGDFGGGTSDFTVIKISNERYKKSDVLSIGGVSVAGDALDGAIMRNRISRYFGSGVQYKVPFGSNILTMPIHLMEKICSPADISLLRKRDTLEFFRNVKTWSLGGEDREKMDRLFTLIEEQIGFELFEEIERTKRGLSEKNSEKFSFHHSDVDLDEEVTQKDFNTYTQEMIDKILKSLDQTVKDAQVPYDKIDLVCSTGGTAKVAAIRQGLEDRFGAPKIRQHNHFHSIVHGLIHMAKDESTNS
ncbi:Hsp70 family protein [bacterium]|nr:Hsp70 family protein [bacterium]